MGCNQKNEGNGTKSQVGGPFDRFVKFGQELENKRQFSTFLLSLGAYNHPSVLVDAELVQVIGFLQQFHLKNAAYHVIMIYSEKSVSRGASKVMFICVGSCNAHVSKSDRKGKVGPFWFATARQRQKKIWTSLFAYHFSSRAWRI